MKKLSLLFVSAIFAWQTNAVAQSVKTTAHKNHKHTVTKTSDGKTTVQTTKTGATQTVGNASNNGLEYATSHRSGINSYKEQTDNAQQGASAENGEETVTITQRELGDKPAATTKTGTKKTSTTAVTSRQVNKPKQ